MTPDQEAAARRLAQALLGGSPTDPDEPPPAGLLGPTVPPKPRPLSPTGPRAPIFPWTHSVGETPPQPATLSEPARSEAELAADAFAAAARRRQREVRGPGVSPYAPVAPASEFDLDNPGLIERTRLNGVDSFYRGTLTGAGRLALMEHYASTPDEEGIDPRTKRWRDQLRRDYPHVLADLDRYDRMRSFSGVGEGAAAFLGQLGGGMTSPESWIGAGAKGGQMLWRIGKAGLKQGAINGASDPVVQGLNIQAGVQDEYDPLRTAKAAAFGTVFGSAVRGGAEWATPSRIGAKAVARRQQPSAAVDPYPPNDAGSEALLASRSARLYDPPAKPLRPTEADYPQGVPGDAAGKITHDIEGRPLTARHIAGRRVAAGFDQPLTAEEVVAAATQTLGRQPKAVAASEIGGDAGRLYKTTDRRSQRSDYELLWNRGLASAAAQKVIAHEFGHLVDDIAGRISVSGLNTELRQLYNTLNTGQERTRHLTGPQHLGYSGDHVFKELMAEAIRAYIASPNYIKTVAPKTAAAIREAVNSHPVLSKIIQFNSLAAIGYGLASEDEE